MILCLLSLTSEITQVYFSVWEQRLINPIFFRFGSARRQRKEINLSAVLLCICFVFFFCHAPRVVSNVIEFWNRDKVIKCDEMGLHFHPDKFTHALMYISDIATILNSSLNFFVYCFVGHTFRRELCRTLGFQVNKLTIT